MPETDYAALASKHGGTVDYSALAAKHGAVSDVELPAETRSIGGPIAMAAGVASQALPAVEQGVKTALASPNAPRVIQRTIGAGVRGAATALGAAVAGVPGAVGGAAVSEGLTPTQQTIRGWLGRSAGKAATSAAPASDAVINYIESMGADAKNLTGASLEYAKKAGRAILYDATGRASLVPTESAAAKVAPIVASKGASLLSRAVKFISDAGPILGAFGAEGEALQKLNSPASLSEFAKSLDPRGRLKLAQMLTETKKFSPAESMQIASGGDAKKFGALMTAYMQSRQAMPQQAQQPALKPDPNNVRADGSQKGTGFLGVLQRPDGRVSSEISIGVNIGGKEVEIPTLVPTLNQQEKQWLIMNDVSDPKKIPQSIIQKAVDFARTRMSAGKSPFAQPGEGPQVKQ